MKTFLNLIWAGMFATLAASAQIQESRGVAVRGEIDGATVIPGNVTVELTGNGFSRGDSAPVSSDGRFEFRSVPAGSYWLRVVAGDGRVLQEEPVTINGSQQLLSVRLNVDQRANRSAGSSVSMQQLTHKVPRTAQKAYDKGLHAASKGDQRVAADFFGQAVAADPEFVDAHNELGAADVKLGQLPEAAEQFQKAIDLVPEHRMALPNLSIVLAKMKRFREAGEVARRALRVVPGMAQMQYILALGLISEHKEPQEAIKNLRSAAGEIPKAHIVAAEALLECGKRDEAVLELEQYLGTHPPNDADRTRVEAVLAGLRGQK